MIGQSRLLYSLAKDGLFFERFKHLDPVTQVPSSGSWISGIAVILTSVFLNIEELTFIISIENLFTYSLVNCALLALRFREDPEKRHPNERWTWLYLVLAFIFSISWGYSWHWSLIVILAIAVVAMIVKLH
jgi:amino acid transporter